MKNRQTETDSQKPFNTENTTSLKRENIYYTVSQKNIPDVFSYNSRKH